MQATFRKPFAAALLLVPLAAALAAPAARAERVETTRTTTHVVVRDVDHHDARAEHRDHRAPRISAVTPANGGRIEEHGRAHISALLSDDASGVDPASVRLRVDGRNVTRAARISRDVVEYGDHLAPGRHKAELQVRDHAGNSSRLAWSFNVVRWDHRG